MGSRKKKTKKKKEKSNEGEEGKARGKERMKIMGMGRKNMCKLCGEKKKAEIKGFKKIIQELG